VTNVSVVDEWATGSVRFTYDS